MKWNRFSISLSIVITIAFRIKDRLAQPKTRPTEGFKPNFGEFSPEFLASLNRPEFERRDGYASEIW